MTDHDWQDDSPPRGLDLALWRRVLGLARPYRGRLAGMAAFGIIVAAVDVTAPRATGWIIDAAVHGEGIEKGLVLYVACAVILALSVFAFIEIAGSIVTGLAFDLRRDGFRRLQELSFSYYDRHPVGWLMSRLTSDVGKLAGVIPWAMLDLVWGTALILATSVMMLVMEWRLALVVLAMLPLLVGVSLFFQKRLLATQRATRRANARLTSAFNEAIQGVRTTKTLVRERESLAEFQVESTDMFRHSLQNSLLSAAYLPLVLSLGSIGVGLALWRGGVSAGTFGVDGSGAGGDLTLGTLIAFMQYAAFLTIPVQELAQRFAQIQAAQAAAERMHGLLAMEPEIKDAPAVVARLEARRQRGAELPAGPAGEAELADDGLPQCIRTIEFRKVEFAYTPGRPVLQDFDLTVRRGETIALVGATGSGKTTVVSLLARFYEPTAGQILVDGVDYRERAMHWWYSQLGVVLQTPHLFSGTVRDNIRYGRLEATDAEVEEAARRVHAHGMIEALEHGYATEVGERGDRLSTGQKQLVALARAVLADPQILILDEATSSIDVETERLVQAGIDAILSGRTCFVIAHRLSTIRSAHRILVIEQGRLLEAGSHQELLRRGGAYHRLYTRQLAAEEEASVLTQARREATASPPSW